MDPQCQPGVGVGGHSGPAQARRVVCVSVCVCVCLFVWNVFVCVYV